jgi:hypothetical protein
VVIQFAQVERSTLTSKNTAAVEVGVAGRLRASDCWVERIYGFANVKTRATVYMVMCTYDAETVGKEETRRHYDAAQHAVQSHEKSRTRRRKLHEKH